MAVETSTDVEQINKVQTESGRQVAPASDDDVVLIAGSADLDANGDQTLTPAKIDAAERLTILAEFGNDGHVEVHYLDADGTRVTSRTPSENGEYSVTGGGDVYVEPGIASPYLEIDLVDDTANGTANSTSWTVYLR